MPLTKVSGAAQRFISRASRYVRLTEDAILVALLLVMVLLAGYDIVARTFFGGGAGWIAPALKIMVLWVGLLGALLATRTREHIAIDIVSRIAPVKAKQALLVLTSLFSAVVCLLIAWYSTEFVRFSKLFGDIAFNRVPAWPLQIIIPISFALMGVRFLLQSGQAALALLVVATQPSNSLRTPE